MLPKIEASIDFINAGKGRHAIITSMDMQKTPWPDGAAPPSHSPGAGTYLENHGRGCMEALCTGAVIQPFISIGNMV